jgi:hydroxymethylbilane synthase
MTHLRIATRASPLALAQAAIVAKMLEATNPDLEVSIVEVVSTGDIDTTTPVAALTEIGAFVRSVQTVLLSGDADLAVHSGKDLPVQGPSGLVSYYPERGSPWDAICGGSVEALPRNGRVGTGSPRRLAQIRLLRPDLQVSEIRGNVETRLSQVERGVLDAVVLAEAGLTRLGLSDRIEARFGASEMVPAPAQGALAVEVVEGSEAEALVAPQEHATTRAAVEAERHLLAVTGAGCRAALGALAVHTGGGFTMWGFVEDGSGPRRAVTKHSDPIEAAEAMRGELGL